MDIFEISKSIFSYILWVQSSWKFKEMFLGSLRRDWPVYIFELGLFLNYDFENSQSGILNKNLGITFQKSNKIFLKA